ncbi:hypothetical protein T11_15861 [Trichinella zimbabwensis]|uniref:Uncharacterized protein n=1 Tax=Trichinella zimbabwensis TaxID=268475 RepID=A0A0V1GI98_9BILA|nr:hypothetical protein T11_15861 [Trichinella zimbabwensis]
MRGPSKVRSSADNPSKASLHSHRSVSRFLNVSGHEVIVIIDADQDIDHYRRSLPLSHLGFSLCRSPIGVLTRHWLDLATDPRDRKRLHQSACPWCA